MFEPALLFGTTVAQMYFRTQSYRHISGGDCTRATCNSVIISTLYLTSTALGVKGALTGDIVLIVVFILANAVGTLMGTRAISGRRSAQGRT